MFLIALESSCTRVTSRYFIKRTYEFELLPAILWIPLTSRCTVYSVRDLCCLTEAQSFFLISTICLFTISSWVYCKVIDATTNHMIPSCILVGASSIFCTISDQTLWVESWNSCFIKLKNLSTGSLRGHVR